MSKIDNIINALQECADGDNIIAFGFVCDISNEPATAKDFAIGSETQLAEGLSLLLDEEILGRILTKALSLRIRTKINELSKKNNDEKGHSSLNWGTAKTAF